MTPKDFLFDAILSAVSTDSESADLIWQLVERWAKDEGQLVTREQLDDALCEMTESGLLSSYIESKEEGRLKKVAFKRELLPELWFESREVGSGNG